MSCRNKIHGFSRVYRGYEERIATLENLKKSLLENEESLLQAVVQDLGRESFESKLAELFPIHREINYFFKNLKSLMKPKSVRGTLATLGSKSFIETIPYGVVAVISPWNYPLSLSLIPLIGALAAGNRVVLKPSEFSPAASEVLKKVLAPLGDVVLVCQGDKSVSEEILESEIDYLFFTGSSRVGKRVAEACAKRLIPYTLELGGKSPCIIESSACFEVAAKRILWGKLLNAGQTCVAPDYILVKEQDKDRFVRALVGAAQELLATCSNFTRIITPAHRERLEAMLAPDQERIIFQHNLSGKNLFPLTILEATLESACMQEEIFGPILPIICVKDCKEAIENIHKIDKTPLALYLFSTDSQDRTFYGERITSGGMCVNDLILQVENHALPFGGIGQSGVGQYHGAYSYQTFSHHRAVLVNRNTLLLDLRFSMDEKRVEALRPFLA